MARGTSARNTALKEKDANTAAAPPNSDDGKGNASDSSSPKKKTDKRTKKLAPKSKLKDQKDLKSILLEGEEDGTIRIYDTCDDIRKKIRDLLKKNAKSNHTALAREFSSVVPHSDAVDGRQLRRFMEFKGPHGGGHTMVFYAGYVYFEKCRIRDGKGKSAKRSEMEEEWMERGFPRLGSQQKFITRKDNRPTINRLGALEFYR